MFFLLTEHKFFVSAIASANTIIKLLSKKIYFLKISGKGLGYMVSGTIVYGVFLILWGTVISIYSDSKSFTSWIPSLIGLPILLSGIISSVYPNKKKMWMHVSVVFGLLAFLGGLDFLRGFSGEMGPFEKPTAGLSKLMLLTTGGIFTFYNIKSFIAARKMTKES